MHLAGEVMGVDLVEASSTRRADRTRHDSHCLGDGDGLTIEVDPEMRMDMIGVVHIREARNTLDRVTLSAGVGVVGAPAIDTHPVDGRQVDGRRSQWRSG